MSTKTRLWVLVTGLLCALVVLYGFLAGLLPQLAAAAQVRAESENTQLIIETQRIQLAKLQEADRDAEQLAETLVELELAIPTGPDWPEFLRELQQLQAATGAVVSEVTVQASILPLADAAATDPAATDPAATDPAAADTAATDPAVTDPTAITPTTNLIQIPLALTVTGTTDQVAAFLRLVQTGSRLFVVSDVEIDALGEITTGIANGSIYVVP